jgi:3',5'-cyclic AMP phosphodiesterase CpdA
MAPPAFTLLHLSDLHFAAPEGRGHYWNSEATELQLAAHDRRGLLGSLVRDLRQQNLVPELVVVTGDLLDRGSVAGVPMAVRFLEELCAGLGLPRRRMILVPGNHDVLRDAGPAGRYVLFDQIWRGFYGDEWPRFTSSTPDYHRVHLFDLSDELGVEVVGFNSCEALDPARKQEYGSVGTAQRDRAEQLLEANRGRSLFRIAAMHHHLESPEGTIRGDYSVMADAPLTLRWLMRQRFQLVLHGHQHVDWQVPRQEEQENWLMTITAAGSAGVASYGRSEWQLQLGYQVIRVEGGTAGWRRRREYDPQSREWIDAGRGEARRSLRFGFLGPEPGTLAEEPASALSDLPEVFLPRLLELVATQPWPRPLLKAAYLASAPAGWGHEFDGHEGDDLARRMLLRLHNALWQSDGTHPFLKLVRHLVEIANDPCSPPELLELYGGLSRWFDQASAALGMEMERREALKARVQEDRRRLDALELHLILSIARSARARERFIVHAWRALVSSASTTWAHEDLLPLEPPGGEGPHSLAELPGLVMELLAQLHAELLHVKGNLTLSLFVPVELLDHAADRWEVDLGLESSLLGAEYKVLVRSWERAYSAGCARIVPKWRDRWERLRMAPERAVCQYGPEHVSGDGAQLEGPAEDPACAVLRFVPDSTEGVSPILRRLLSQGIPVAIWPREAPRDEGRLRHFLDALSSKNPLRLWREEVWAFRREARASGQEHPGSHLTLLWDDPNKLPPDALGWARLGAPVKPEDTKS